MPYLEWNDELDVGVEPMNAQHRSLIDLMNRLWDQDQAGASRTELAKTFDELADYTTRHFTAEEAHMERIGYPLLNQHKHIHADLLQQLETHRKDFQARGGLDRSLFSFLKLWLSAHIKGIDVQYGQHGQHP